MGILSKILGRSTAETSSAKAGGMEDFMTLIRVYFQAVMAADLHITNLAALPDLRVFKATLKVPTVNNRLGVGEKQRVQTYLYQFQGFTQDLMMLASNILGVKARIPSIFKKTLYAVTAKAVDDIFNKNDFKDAGVMKSAVGLRQLNKKLGFSQEWVTQFVYRVLLLAKKEPRPKESGK